jgi:hypothetical protein
VKFSTLTKSPPIAVATNSSGYIAATTLIDEEAVLLSSDEPHPVRISPSAAAPAISDNFFFMVLIHFLIDNDSY